MSFPEIRFGECSVCGGKSGPQTSGLQANADAPVRSTPGTAGYDVGGGLVLKKYRGQLMCEVCIETAKSDAESLRSAKRHIGAERFRGKAGFLNTVS